MAKSLRSKRKKRLRTIRREIAEPLYEKKDAAKLAAQEAALAAPKLPVYVPINLAPMDYSNDPPAPASASASMDVGMTDAIQESRSSLKPVGGVGKKSKKNFKLKKRGRQSRGKGKGKIGRKRI